MVRQGRRDLRVMSAHILLHGCSDFPTQRAIVSLSQLIELLEHIGWSQYLEAVFGNTLILSHLLLTASAYAGLRHYNAG